MATGAVTLGPVRSDPDVAAAAGLARDFFAYMRTTYPERAVLIDFMDETNDYFLKHSKARLEAYRAEPSFNVKVIG